MTRSARRRGERLLVSTCLVFLAWSSALAVDQELDPGRIEFVVGNGTFVALHEFAHAVLEDFEVPVLGNSEDAADTLAAVYLIRRGHADPVSNFRYIRMLLMAMHAGWSSAMNSSRLSTSCQRNRVSLSWNRKSAVSTAIRPPIRVSCSGVTVWAFWAASI